MAAVEFNVNRVLEFLARQETEGAAFYEKAAVAVGDPKASKMFLKLSGDEKRHEGFYRNLITKYDNQTHTLEEKDMQYLDLLLCQPSPIKTAEMETKEKKVWDKDQALDVAEHLERDTILFLSQLLSVNSVLTEEKAFSEALKEEKQHLSQILQSRMDGVSSDMML